MKIIFVMSLKWASGRFFFHFSEIFEKCIEYTGKFLVQFREILNFSRKIGLFLTNFRSSYCSFPGVSLMMREVSHVWKMGTHFWDSLIINVTTVVNYSKFNSPETWQVNFSR